MNQNGNKRERRCGGGQLQDLEPVLQGTTGLNLPHSGWCDGLRKKNEGRILHKHNLIIIPHICQTELIFRSHDQM